MKVLVYRFSAFGDVTLVVPAIRNVISSNADIEITFVSGKEFEPLFNGIPNFTFYAVDLKQYPGLKGLVQLFREINSMGNWDLVLDLHSVIRTWVLDALFVVTGHRLFRLRKGRKEKYSLVRRHKKRKEQLKHTLSRYLDVFEIAGLKVSSTFENTILHNFDDDIYANVTSYLDHRKLVKDGPWIAIAPFSKHKQKEWPLDKMREVIKYFAEEKGFKIFLYGAGPFETPLLQDLEDTIENTYSLAGKLNLEEEIILLKSIDVMVSMDSFNMHLAALSGIKVVSIWGATHPLAGFGPLNDNEKYVVQDQTLDCRPCSVFGSKECYRGDIACLEIISIDEVKNMIEKALSE